MASLDIMHRVDVFVPDDAWGGQPVDVILRGADGCDEAASGAPIDGALETGVVTAGSAPTLEALRGGQPQPFSVNAALAAAHVLRTHGGVTADPIDMTLPLVDTEVHAPAAGDPSATWWLRVPTISLGRAWPTPQVLALLGLQDADGLSGLPVQMTSLGQPFLLVPVAGLAALSACRLDAAAFKGFAVKQVRHHALRMAVLVFAEETRDAERDLALRLFRPSDPGAPEAASGDAAACLGAYLLQHERLAPGGSLCLEQGHESGRPSRLRLRAGPRGLEVGGAVRAADDEET